MLACDARGATQNQTLAEAVEHGADLRTIIVCAATAAARYSGVSAYVNPRDLLADGPYDIVDICVPLEDRYAAASAALRAGANVLCATPLAETVEETKLLIKLASERERLLMPAFVHRFHPPLVFLKELLDTEDLGTLTMFRCRFADTRNFLESGAVGAASGVLLDTALHGVDLFRYLVGEVKSVAGRSTTTTPGLRVEDNAALILQSEGSALGVIEASQNLPGSRNVVEAYGTIGSCVLDYDGGVVRYFTADTPVWQNRDVGGFDGFESILVHFTDAVRGLQPLLVSGHDALRAQEICSLIA